MSNEIRSVRIFSHLIQCFGRTLWRRRLSWGKKWKILQKVSYDLLQISVTLKWKHNYPKITSEDIASSLYLHISWCWYLFGMIRDRIRGIRKSLVWFVAIAMIESFLKDNNRLSKPGWYPLDKDIKRQEYSFSVSWCFWKIIKFWRISCWNHTVKNNIQFPLNN